MKLYFFSRPGTTDRDLGELTGRNSQPLPASASFPRMSSADSGVSGVSQWVSPWSPETVEEAT